LKILPKILHPSYVSVRNKPVNLKAQDANMFEPELQKTIHATVLFESSDAIFTYDGILLKKLSIHESSIINEKTKKLLKFKYPLNLLKNGKFRKIKTDTKTVVVTNYYWPGYFHWLTESLTKLVAAKDLLKNNTLILPEPKHEFHAASLKPFLPERVEYLKPNEYTKPNTNLYISYTAPPGNYNKKYITEVASTIKNYYADKKIIGHDKVYISRKKAPKRRIANEEALESLLKSFGYTCVTMEDYSFAEQVNICLNATTLISLHGAGLTNMMFMNKNSKVVELRQKGEFQNNCYFTLASDMELQYYYLICEKVNPNEKNHTADVIVDIEALKELVVEMDNKALHQN
jgi:capsular polysaccharide biosynthesis protein